MELSCRFFGDDKKDRQTGLFWVALTVFLREESSERHWEDFVRAKIGED